MRYFLGVVLFGLTTSAVAQATESTMKICKEQSRKIAGNIVEARSKKVDLDELRRNMDSSTTTHWGRSVGNYMFHAAIDAPTLTERELATLGYTYCIERRPAGS